jgi:hypothetical protein
MFFTNLSFAYDLWFVMVLEDVASDFNLLLPLFRIIRTFCPAEMAFNADLIIWYRGNTFYFIFLSFFDV